jgi:hypothetical protein
MAPINMKLLEPVQQGSMETRIDRTSLSRMRPKGCLHGAMAGEGQPPCLKQSFGDEEHGVVQTRGRAVVVLVILPGVAQT